MNELLPLGQSDELIYNCVKLIYPYQVDMLLMIIGDVAVIVLVYGDM